MKRPKVPHDPISQMRRSDRGYLLLEEVAWLLDVSETDVLKIPQSELERNGVGKHVIFPKPAVCEYIQRRDRERDADAIEPNEIDLQW